MSLITIQQILQRLDRPNEIAARLSVLKSLNTTESKNIIKLCKPFFASLPIEVGTKIYSVVHPSQQTQFVHQWTDHIFKVDHMTLSDEIVQKIFKVGDVVKHTQIPLSTQVHHRAFKALSSLCTTSKTIDEIYRVLPSVVENYIAYNIDDLKKICHQMHPNINRVNRRAHNIVSSFKFANADNLQEIEHLLNWTGFLTLSSKNWDELRALMQNITLHKEVESVSASTTKRKM